MAEPIVLSLSHRVHGWGTRRTLHVRNIRELPIKAHDITFDLLGEEAPEPELLDGFLFGIVSFPMRMRRPLRVEGRVSRQALHNLGEFQDCWVGWKPQTYGRIAVEVAEVADPPRPAGAGAAVGAFSGGVDSTFTVLRHRLGLAGPWHFRLEAALLVHGFDVPLRQEAGFDALAGRLRPFLDAHGLPLKRLRTNLREVSLQHWEDSHGAQIACCLANYAHAFRYGLIASTQTYDTMAPGWGSTPVADPLLSGAGMEIRHDGAGYSRLEKIAEVMRHGPALRQLRVCFSDLVNFGNCGRCGKCLRTRLAFFALGMPHPPCFDEPFDPALIATLPADNASALRAIVSVHLFALRRRIAAPWVGALGRRIAVLSRQLPVADRSQFGWP